MPTKILSAKYDFIFKLIFGDENNTDILAAFLMAVLDLPYSDFEDLRIIDPNLPREFEDDKQGILDVKLKLKSDKIIDVEIQVKPLPHLRERAIYYTSKMVTEQIHRGQDYYKIQPVVTILVCDFPLFKDDDVYHHKFELFDRKNATQFSDTVTIHTLELPKLPQTDDHTAIWTWAKFIDTIDKEELHMLAERSPVLDKAVGVRMVLSEDERLRMLAEAREKARRDDADMLWGARREGINHGISQIIQNMLSLQLSLNEIARFTGLSVSEIERLQQ